MIDGGFRFILMMWRARFCHRLSPIPSGLQRNRCVFPGYLLYGFILTLLAVTSLPPVALSQTADQYIRYWSNEWPVTDFTRHSVPFSEILHGGPPRDGIPPIDAPVFAAIPALTDADRPSATAPVIGLVVNGEAKAYPLSVLIWHEIVNDEIGGVPVCVTFCPLCNAAIVFDRRLGDRVLDFGTTGKLRHSDLIMWDRQTESWWQQFTGEAIVGALTGQRLRMLPARLESFERFAARLPDGTVLLPDRASSRRYGRNPYDGYDSSARPFLFRGKIPDEVPPLMRVVTLGPRGAWSLALLRARREVTLQDGTVIRWAPGQASALDNAEIDLGRDVGNITVTRTTPDGTEDVLHGVDFAFAYRAFYPDAPIHHVPDAANTAAD